MSVVTVVRQTSRRDAIYQAIEPGHHPEHLLLGGVAIGARLVREVRRVVPAVREIAVPDGGSGRLSAVVALDAEVARAAAHGGRCSPSGRP